MKIQSDKKHITVPTPSLVPLPSSCKKITAGPNHSFAIASDKVYQWGRQHHETDGRDQQQQQPARTTEDLSRELTVIPISVENISTNRYHSFAWGSEEVYCWGSNHCYELGLTEEKDYGLERMAILESAIKKGYQLKQVSCGEHHTLAHLYVKDNTVLAREGNDELIQVVEKAEDYDDSSPIQLYAWGQSESFQLTINSHNIIPYPVLSPCHFQHLDHLYSKNDYNVALCNGKAYSWGCNLFSRLGQPIPSSQLPKVRIPREVSLPSKIGKIGIGTYHVVAVSEAGEAFAWGKGNQGQLGIGHFEAESKPLKVLCEQQIVQVCCGDSHTMVLLKDGRLKTCGSNSYDVLGHSQYSTKDRKKRAKILQFVEGLKHIGQISMVSCGNSHNLVINKQGRVYGWGNNQFNQVLPAISSISKPERKSFPKQKRSLEIIIDVDNDLPVESIQDPSLKRLLNWKKRYSSFLQTKQRQQQELLFQLQQITNNMKSPPFN